jgi:hypothetical protein
MTYHEYRIRYCTSIDNPASRHHYRYQRIVDRLAIVAIGTFLCLLAVEVTGSRWGLLIPLLATLSITVALHLAMFVAWLLGSLIRQAIEFINGY